MEAKNLKVLVLGYGAREHALAWKIAQSPRVDQVFVAPGNAGTAQIATNVPISDEDTNQLVQFALENQIDLTVVGTNDPLALGVVDAFQAVGLAIFGPTQAAARLESSKAFAKAFMQKHDIPTPAFAAFDDFEKANAYLDQFDPDQDLVVKVSGLGKMGMGVNVCDDQEQARDALREYMIEGILGEVDQVLIEERVYGAEVSIFALSDGKNAVPLMPVRDYKRVYDNNDGPNTGGMGAYGPPPDVDQDFIDCIMDCVIQPTITGMAQEGHPYAGVLYAGVMITDQGPKVLEFNCRFGNPEALVIMSLLESDLVDLMEACLEGRLLPEDVRLRDGSAAAVMLTSPQYPAEGFPTGLPISGVECAQELAKVEVFHHGTALENGQLVTSRGRVIAAAGIGKDLTTALCRAYKGAEMVSFEGAHYRQDIGREHIMISAQPKIRSQTADISPFSLSV